jgi:hypothetical protein
MNKNEHGFGFVGLLVVIVILAVIGATGWLAWSKQDNKNTAADNKKTPTQSAGLKGELSFVSAKEADGWAQEHVQGGSLYVLNSSEELGCYVSAGVDKPKLDLSAARPLAGTPSREVTLGSANPSYKDPSVTVYDIGQDKEYFVSEGYIEEADFDVVVRIACKNKANFPVADAALKGISLQ